MVNSLVALKTTRQVAPQSLHSTRDLRPEPAEVKAMRNVKSFSNALFRIAACAALIAFALVTRSTVPNNAQRARDKGANIARIETRDAGSDAKIVTFAADAPLNYAQMWQDAEGFHVVLYRGQTSLSGAALRGVKSRQVGDSLEFIVPVKNGAKVVAQRAGTSLVLNISGGAQTATATQTATIGRDYLVAPTTNSQRGTNGRATRRNNVGANSNGSSVNATSERDAQASLVTENATNSAADMNSTATRRNARTPRANNNARTNVKTQNDYNPADTSVQQNRISSRNTVAQDVATAPYIVPGANSRRGARTVDDSAPLIIPSQTLNQSMNMPPLAANRNVTISVPPTAPQTVVTNQPTKTVAAPNVSNNAAQASEDSGSIFFSPYFITAILACGLIGLVVARTRKRKQETVIEQQAETIKEQKILRRNAREEKSRHKSNANLAQPFGKAQDSKNKETNLESKQTAIDKRNNTAPNGTNAESLATAPQSQASSNKPTVAMTTAATESFGAYRIEQEVGKLLSGQAHSIDVLASRAPEDRRAIETSLLKTLRAPKMDADADRKIRQALEDYGFVARLSASLLLSNDTYDRSSAARVLGEIRSPAALPFLIEALYDREMIVRTEAVTSLGALRNPRAIGALLDIARRHSDIPQTLLSQALSQCSVESLNFMDAEPQSATSTNLLGTGEKFDGEIKAFEPLAELQNLPEWLEDETLTETLERLQSTDTEARVAAARGLAQFRTQSSVTALTALATEDEEAAVRSAAVASLAAIDHESVFSSILKALADEAREVRAAAARGISRLSFDRADAYVRLSETESAADLQKVAQAFDQAGFTTQMIDRLAHEDRRQSYEAFALLSLCAKAGECGKLLSAIESHANQNVRLAAVRVLSLAEQTACAATLRQLAVREGMPEEVRAQILEAIYKLDQATVEDKAETSLPEAKDESASDYASVSEESKQAFVPDEMLFETFGQESSDTEVASLVSHTPGGEVLVTLDEEEVVV